MRKELTWAAAAVALAAAVLLHPPAAGAQESGDASANASAGAGQDAQSTDSAAGDTAGQANAQSSTQTQASTSAATDNATTGQTGSGAANDATGTEQSAQGQALPPPDASVQQQERSAQVQDQSAQSHLPRPQVPPNQRLSQDQRLDRDQQLNRDRQRDEGGLQNRITGDVDASTQGQANVRSGMRDHVLRHDGLRDVDIGIRFGATTGRGLVIDTIDRNSVFLDSGLRRGDILVSLDGRPIRSEVEFVEWVQMHPGERIPVVVLRDGRQQTIFITYDQQPMVEQSYQTAQQPVVGSQPFLGVMFDVQAPNAAVVRDVTPGSPAEHAGLRRGDMITAINGQVISSYHDVIGMIRMMRPGDQLVIDFSRQVTDQTQALLAGRPGEVVRTATAPDLRYGREVAPIPQPMFQDRPVRVPPYGYDRDPRMIDRERDMRRPLRDRGVLPRLLN